MDYCEDCGDVSQKMNIADFNELSEVGKGHFYKVPAMREMLHA